ncbi:MAG: metallophosphoesterase, partial [Candidatus Bathyarchaeota archaeon]|nr:metallophosphoesterase [Candidatus Bathyarchaeota archaeon]
MSSNSESINAAVSLIIEAGYQIDREAFEFLKKISHKIEPSSLVKAVVDEINALSEKPLFITRKLLEEKIDRSILAEVEKSGDISFVSGKAIFQPYAESVESDIKVISDPTGKISAAGSLEDYIEYFRSRFRKLSKIIRSRGDAKDSGSISDALRAPENSKVKFICMVTDKRETKRGIFFKVEDLESCITVFAPAERQEIYLKAQRILLDQVICVSALRGRDNLFVLEDIILPDTPLRKPARASAPVCAVLLSDLHVGSKMFMEKEFKHFIRWLRGEVGGENLRGLAGRVKYLIIAGDIIDGVGIYPQQYDELEIKDIYKQYERAARELEDIPDHIEIIIIPGNHDATRRALPQPAIPREY